MDKLFTSILESRDITASSFLVCTAVSLVLGALIAAAYMFKSTYTKGFVVTVAVLPAIVQVIIMMVNGEIGTGIAVAGAFSLVRFRSAPGTAKEICSIFLAMAVGLATGMGHLGAAAVFTVIVLAVLLVYTLTGFGSGKAGEKDLRITIPENLDYEGLFDDIFKAYTFSNELVKVKTTNLGSLYKLQYRIVMKNAASEKKMLDEIRCRNGNLDIICGKVASSRDEL